MKLNIKSRLKNFFTLPEEDLQEEECTKTFEKTTLFTLTKNKLFFGILFFLILVDLLVAFDLKSYYARATLSFLFITIVPGLLIMLMMKIREVGFWEYLVYTIGLSISFIMFGGLAVNWILPWLNITDKPLATWPILICFNIFLIAFWIIAWIRNKDLEPFKIQLPKLDAINRIMFVIPVFFPVLAVLGAFILNNHGTNILTMIMLGGIAVYVLMIVLLRKKLNENIYPWAILMIGLALLLSNWLRSWFVSGNDINLEYLVFQITKQNFIWSINNYANSYNAMLSLTILPTLLSLFTQIKDSFIFKLIIPLLFSFVPLVIFLVFKNFYKNNLIIFLGTFFFISQSFFISIEARQPIAFIFFTLLIHIIVKKNTRSSSSKIFFLIFGISMIVSHYSTAYIALALFLIIYIIYTIYKK